MAWIFGRRKTRIPNEAEISALNDVMAQIIKASASEDRDQLRVLLLELEAIVPEQDSTCRTVLVSGFESIGDLDRARLHMAIAMAESPDQPQLFRRLARWCRQDGLEAEAERILDIGWIKARKLLGPDADKHTFYRLDTPSEEA